MGLEGELESREGFDLLLGYIGELPINNRMAVILRMFGYTFREIGEVLGLSRARAEQLEKKGRRLLYRRICRVEYFFDRVESLYSSVYSEEERAFHKEFKARREYQSWLSYQVKKAAESFDLLNRELSFGGYNAMNWKVKASGYSLPNITIAELSTLWPA